MLDTFITSTTAVQNALSSYVVRPLNAFGLGGFVFDIDRDTTIRLKSEITDHYVEDNSAVQDHIALRPISITLRNYVGELVDRRDTNTQTNLQKMTQKLTTYASFLPSIIQSANKIKSTIETKNLNVSNLTDVGLNLWGLVKNLNPAQTKQAQAYLYFNALWEQKILVSCETPFKFITDMIIEELTATQGEDSKDISDFSITLKQIRKTSLDTVKFNKETYSGRGAFQRAAEVNNGKAQGTKEELSSTLYNSIYGAKE